MLGIKETIKGKERKSVTRGRVVTLFQDIYLMEIYIISPFRFILSPYSLYLKIIILLIY